MTLEMKIQEYLVAPSKIKKSEVLEIGRIIFFNCHCCSLSELKQFLQNPGDAQTDTAQRPQTDPPLTLKVDDLLCKTYTTHNLQEDEASGYLPLGNIVVYFGALLSDRLNSTYLCHPQRSVANTGARGQNPSTDVAIIMREKVKYNYISRVLYEYKPGSVGTELEQLQSLDLMELFLQCFYVIKYEALSEIIGCLTDLHSWHYFSLKKIEKGNKMIVEGYSKITMSMPPKGEEMTEHFLLLLQYLSPEH